MCIRGAGFQGGVFAIASGFYVMVKEVTEGLSIASVPYSKGAGSTFPGVFGSIATVYFEKYGATREHLMNVTIKKP